MNQLCACRSVIGALLLTALCGLFSAPPAHAEEDARRATPPPGKALVFVFRIDREPLAAQVPVIVNTVLVGELANGTFVTTTVGPGRNYLQIGDRAPSTLVVEANQSYFVRVRALGNPPSVRTEVNLLSEAEGRRSLAQSRFDRWPQGLNYGLSLRSSACRQVLGTVPGSPCIALSLFPGRPDVSLLLPGCSSQPLCLISRPVLGNTLVLLEAAVVLAHSCPGNMPERPGY